MAGGVLCNSEVPYRIGETAAQLATEHMNSGGIASDLQTLTNAPASFPYPVLTLMAAALHLGRRVVSRFEIGDRERFFSIRWRPSKPARHHKRQLEFIMVTDCSTQPINDTALGGTGLLAVFCDLEPEWRADFRPWLIEDMFPPRAAIGFGPAASFDLIEDAIAAPSGSGDGQPQSYVTIYVAPTFGALYDQAYQGLRSNRAPRDAAYHREMQNQARYAAAWLGPGIESEEKNFAPVIVIDRFNLAPADTQAFNIWYSCEYLPACAMIGGLKRMRRYLAMEGDADHIVVHEFSSASDLSDENWNALRAHENWKRCQYITGAPAAYSKIVDGS